MKSAEDFTVPGSFMGRFRYIRMQCHFEVFCDFTLCSWVILIGLSKDCSALVLRVKLHVLENVHSTIFRNVKHYLPNDTAYRLWLCSGCVEVAAYCISDESNSPMLSAEPDFLSLIFMVPGTCAELFRIVN
jgi:hypothetical protein